MRNILYVVFIVLSVVSVVSCTDKKDIAVRNQNTGGAFGTTYSIIYFSNETLDFQEEIDSVVQVVNQSMSTYFPGSDISKINLGDTTIVVDAMFKDVFALSAEIHSETEGYFDPTVGPLVNAYGFGPGETMEVTNRVRDSIMQFVGFDKIKLTDGGSIRKAHANVYLDFNAIAKGYAIDRLALMLERKGIENYLVEVGGELVVKGLNKAKDKPWLVGIDDPQAAESLDRKILVHLRDKAMASSGNYRKFRVDQITGERYVHTIDPTTGNTKNGNTLGVTILANSCAVADAYATAFMAMDLEDAVAMIARNQELEALIIYLDENGQTKQFLTDGFTKLVVED